MENRSLIFFDLDHTLVKVNSSFRFGVFLYRQGKLPFFSMLRLLGHYFQYKRGAATLHILHTNIFDTFFRGASASEISSCAVQFWDCHFDTLVDRAMMQKVSDIQERGDVAIILSSSPDFLALEFAKRLKVSICHATPYVADAAGRFSTIPFVVDGPWKADLVKTLAEEFQVPIEKTVGYSDSIDDREFLETVGMPIVINPDRQLRRHAIKHRWQVI